MKTCKSLHSVTLRGVEKSEHSSLLDVVKCCTDVHSLCINDVIFVETGSNICSVDVALLFSDHKSWVNLHTLNISIDPEGAQVLSKVLVHCKSLRCLILSGCGIYDSGVVALAEGLKGHTRLLELIYQFL